MYVCVCLCVYVCVYNGFPALNQSPVIICCVRNTYGKLSRKKAISTISQRTKIQNYAFKKPLSQMETHACAQSYKLTQTHSQMKAHACMQSQSTEGITIFPPSARLDKIKLFPFSDASFLLSNAGFSNNTRFYCGQRIMPQISNSCQMRCDRIQ